ncbi:hypothetical protein [Saccharothrix coeruleofusca]|uniref:hypothetical protein n=1 Tax=Saccharothrix coeruleofusca TaxID=33919 RepID=UPI001670C35C|nr:hypothetical protein [Saccharothrix coeruleofusca]
MIGTAEPVSPATTRLRAALATSVAGALLTALGPVLRVVDPSAPPAFTAWPLLAPLALAPVAAAALLLSRGRTSAAAAALVAIGAFAPGAALRDLQLAVAPTGAARPELFRQTSLTAPTPTTGLWLLLAGHALILVAALLAATAPGEPDGGAGRPRFGRTATAGVIAAVGLLMAPFTATDALIPVRGALDSPALVMAGGALLAAAAALVGVVAASAADAERRRGALLSGAAVLLGLALPPVAAGLLVDGLGLAAGPFLVLVGAVVFAWPETERPDRAVELPGGRRLHRVAAGLGLLAAAAAAAGAAAPQLTLPEGLAQPNDYAARPLWPAAALVAALALALLARTAVRPAFAVALVVLPMTAAGALDAAFAATRVQSVQPGPGVWFTALSVLVAAVAAVAAAVAGSVERDEDGAAPQGRVPLPPLAATLIAALLAVGAFVLPVLRAADFVAIGALDLRIGSWGLLLALATVLAAAAVAPRARPGRGAAVLLGAALVLAVRALEYPLTAARAQDATPGPGLWLALAGALAFTAACALNTTRRTTSR